MAKIITVTIENGDAEVDLAGYKGKGCHAVQEAFQRGFGGQSKKLTRKPEYNIVTAGSKCVTK